jgi:hypothetical protein
MIWIILAFGANFTSCWIRIRIRNADPEPGDKFNADPDPKHWRNNFFKLDGDGKYNFSPI